MCAQWLIGRMDKTHLYAKCLVSLASQYTVELGEVVPYRVGQHNHKQLNFCLNPEEGR